MGKCKVCGKQIPDTLTYCSEKCAEADRNQPTITTELKTPTANTEVGQTLRQHF